MCALPNVEQQTINRVAMPKNNVMRLIRGEVFIGPKQRIFIEPDDEIVTGATLNIGKVLKLSDPELALILGVKESDLPDLRAGKTGLKIVDPSRNAFECAKLLGKIYLYLDYIINGDRDAACSWLRNLNTKLDGIPIDIMKTKPGLEHVESYLDSIQSKI
ncbi:MAG: MbcA/ParS/Xre antitoxin family protein [Candidatus Symbiobacter sp.]|nr:MbcA/ParS/Xre antitoxin family protein [Candidatus Symbiobacter sp.]